MSTLPENVKPCNLTEIRERYVSGRWIREIKIETSDAGMAAKRSIVEGMLDSVATWQGDMSAPMFVTMLGKWSIRVSHKREDCEAEAIEIRKTLQRREASRADVHAMADEIEALRSAIRSIDGLARDRAAVIDGRLDAAINAASALLPPS